MTLPLVPRPLRVSALSATFLASALFATAGLAEGLKTDLTAQVSFDNPKNADAAVSIIHGYQTPEYPYLLKESGLFDDIDYKLDIPIISGPQAQIAALYAHNLDVGHVGDNTAGFEWANADTDWSAEGAVPAIYNIAGATSDQQPFSNGVYAWTSSGVTSLADLKGHTVGYNFGGNIYSAYVSALAGAGVTEAEVQPILFESNPLVAQAFKDGNVEVAVTGANFVQDLVDSGEVKLTASYTDLGVPGGHGFISRPDVLADPGKLAALQDFYARLKKFHAEWVPAHEAAYLQIQQTVNKQTPRVAAINYANYAVMRLYPVGNPAFIAKEQRIVDLAVKNGTLKHQRDVTRAYNPAFDAIVAEH